MPLPSVLPIPLPEPTSITHNFPVSFMSFISLICKSDLIYEARCPVSQVSSPEEEVAEIAWILLLMRISEIVELVVPEAGDR